MIACPGKTQKPMITFQIQRDSPIPYYFQIEEWIRDRIRSGDLRPGDALENEISLAKTLGVSRITVRQALDNLAAQGLIVRKRAIGTFVAQPRKSFVLNRLKLRSLTEEMAEEGLQVKARTLEQKILLPSSEIQSQLGLADGEKVILLRRLRLANGKPLCIETCYHSYADFPLLASIDLTDRSIYEILDREYRRRPVSARDVLVADTADQTIARWLNISAGSAVMHIRRLAYDSTRTPIEVSQTIFRADQHQIVIEYRS